MLMADVHLNQESEHGVQGCEGVQKSYKTRRRAMDDEGGISQAQRTDRSQSWCVRDKVHAMAYGRVLCID